MILKCSRLETHSAMGTRWAEWPLKVPLCFLVYLWFHSWATLLLIQVDCLPMLTSFLTWKEFGILKVILYISVLIYHELIYTLILRRKPFFLFSLGIVVGCREGNAFMSPGVEKCRKIIIAKVLHQRHYFQVTNIKMNMLSSH